MLQTIKRVNRVPMPHPEELQALPPFMSEIVESMKGKVPFSDYKNFARLAVDAANNDLPTMRNAGIRYANLCLQQVANALGSLGEYNPERIPIQTFEKMRLDPQISISLALIKLPIIAQNFRIESESEKCQALADANMRVIYRDLVTNLLKHIDYGFACGEKEYDEKKLKITRTDESGKKRTVYNDWATIIKRIKFAHPTSIRIVRDKRTEEIKWVSQQASFLAGTFNPKGTKKVRIKKCVWHAPTGEYGNFFGESRLKAAYLPWYWSTVMTQYMLRYLERRGSPTSYGKAPPGHSVDSDGNKVDNLEIALKTADSLNNNSSIAYPAMYDKNGKPTWEVGFLNDDQRGDMFINALQYLNVLKSRAMWVPELTANADSGGTNATAESHTDVHLMSEEAEIQQLEAVINTMVLPDFVEYNFPEGQRFPCYIKIDRLTHSRKTLVRDIFLRMLILASGAIKDGYPPVWIPSIRKMAEILEIPGDTYDKIFWQPEEGDDTDNSNPGNPDPDEDDEDDTDDSDTDDGKPEGDNKKEKNSPLEKQQKKQDANKSAPTRKERTRRDRRDRERR